MARFSAAWSAATHPRQHSLFVSDARGGRDADTRPTPRLLDQVRVAIRARRYSPRTESAYVGWIRRFILFHDKRHPVEMAEPEVTRFLTHLAVQGKVSVSTQSQPLNAVLFPYRDVLRRDLDWRDPPRDAGRRCCAHRTNP